MAKKSKRDESDDRTGGEKLIEAIRAKDLDEVKRLIDEGVDVDEMTEEDTPIGVAADVGDEAIVEALLAADADPSFGGLTVPLISAIYGGHDSIFRRLIDAGADPNTGDEEGTTPLMTAARKGRLDLVKLLIEKGGDAKIIDSDGRAAISYAKEHPAIVEYLKPLSAEDQIEALEPKQASGPSETDVRATDNLRRTSFYHAVEARDLPLAKRLLAAGADINARDAFGTTPLLECLGNRAADREMIRWLAQSGADLRARDDYGRSYLMLADRHFAPNGRGEEADRQALRAVLVEIGIISESAVALGRSAAKGDLDELKKLLAAGASLNAGDEKGRTPLWMAVSRQRPEAVTLLLKSGADPSQAIEGDDEVDVQYGGRTMPCPKCGKPTMAMVRQRECAACGNAFDVRQAYQEAPAKRELIFEWANHWKPLMAAARLNDVAIAGKLLDAGAKVDEGRADATPLMCACSFGHVKMASFLIERGANVNAVCKETGTQVKSKLTAVDIAGEEGNLELLELLWAAGATTEKKDAVRLAIAARNGDLKTISSLVKAGVDVNAANPFDGDTPTYAAAVNGRAEALKMLMDAGATIAPPKRGLWPLLMAASAICEGLPRKTRTAADVPRYVETFKLLIAAGASVKVAMFGHTPLKFATDAKCQPLIELFESAEANEKPAKKRK